jgi:hypothetical protein
MPNLANANDVISSKDALLEIEKYTEQAASALRCCLETCDIDQYKHFLDTMYHYTRNTGDKAMEAAKYVQTDELRNFFTHFVEEEDWHYKLARDDLRALGLKPSAHKPQEVVEFDNYWASLAGKHHNWYLGSLYVFENIVKYVANDIRDFIKRLDLKKAESRWLAIHTEADIEHGEEVAGVVKSYLEECPEIAVDAAKEASRLWTNIMTSAFSYSKAA